MKPIATAQIDDQVIRFCSRRAQGVPEWIEVGPLERSIQIECLDNVDRAIRAHGEGDTIRLICYAASLRLSRSSAAEPLPRD